MREFDSEHGWKRGSFFSEHNRGPFRGFGLKFWIVSLVLKEKATGAMIMNKIEEMSMGHWRPSPGQIYPLLEELSSNGYLSIEVVDGKKLYSTTEKGKELLDQSWFPWRAATGLTRFNSIDDALKNVEVLVEYLSDNKEKIVEAHENRERISKIIDRLKEI